MMRNRIKFAALLGRPLILALGLATMQPAFAHDAHISRLDRASMRAHAVTPASHRRHAGGRRLATPGYAGPVAAFVPAMAASYAGPQPHFVPGRGIVGESCDLPTSSCPNDMRISN